MSLLIKTRILGLAPDGAMTYRVMILPLYRFPVAIANHESRTEF
ncbi:hypothetical protein [Nodularia sphaerocarpa]|nr:hypothetical protein [Nodularia sphaerocarpa]